MRDRKAAFLWVERCGCLRAYLRCKLIEKKGALSDVNSPVTYHSDRSILLSSTSESLNELLAKWFVRMVRLSSCLVLLFVSELTVNEQCQNCSLPDLTCRRECLVAL